MTSPARARLQPQLDKCMLWTAKIFPLLPTREESVLFALQLAACVRGVALGGGAGPLPVPAWAHLECLQMADILQRKDMGATLAWRDGLLRR